MIKAQPLGGRRRSGGKTGTETVASAPCQGTTDLRENPYLNPEQHNDEGS